MLHQMGSGTNGPQDRRGPPPWQQQQHHQHHQHQHHRRQEYRAQGLPPPPRRASGELRQASRQQHQLPPLSASIEMRQFIDATQPIPYEYERPVFAGTLDVPPPPLLDPALLHHEVKFRSADDLMVDAGGTGSPEAELVGGGGARWPGWL